MQLQDLGQDVLRYVLHFLELWDIQNIAKSCKLFSEICNHSSIIRSLTFLNDAMITDCPFSDQKYSQLRVLVLNDDYDCLSTVPVSRINKYWDELLFNDSNNSQHAAFTISEYLSNNTFLMKSKFINQNWSHSIQTLKIQSYDFRVVSVFPCFVNLRVLQLSKISSEQCLYFFKNTCKTTHISNTLIDLHIELGVLSRTSSWNAFFDCILDLKSLQFLRIQGIELESSNKEHSKFKDFNNENRYLKQLQSLYLDDVTGNLGLCHFARHLLIGSQCTNLSVCIQPQPTMKRFRAIRGLNDTTPILSVSDILFFKDIITKIENLTINLYELQCIEIMQKLSKNNNNIKKLHIGLYIVEQIKTKFSEFCANAVYEMTKNHNCESLVLEITVVLEWEVLIVYLSKFGNMLNNSNVSKQSKHLKNLQFIFCLNMRSISITSNELIIMIAQSIKSSYFTQSGSVRQNCESLVIDIRLSCYSEKKAIDEYDNLVTQINSNIFENEQVLLRGNNGGDFVFIVA